MDRGTVSRGGGEQCMVCSVHTHTHTHTRTHPRRWETEAQPGEMRVHLLFGRRGRQPHLA